SPQIVDRSLEDLTNKEFSPGKFFKYDNGLSYKLVTITFVWKIDADDFTPQALALSRLLPVINEALFRHIRGKGLSYSSHVYKADHKKFKFVFIELTIPKNPNIEKIVTDEIFPDIKKNVLSKISDEDLSRINKKEKLIQEAAIISQRNRYDHLLYGLDVYKKIISVEAIREMYKVITIEHLKAWKKSLATTAPAIVVSGDID
ncbi:MAG TPA: hypothetical protein VG965_04770, partial [Patescibacteria group bacterium]|nr:hypothetical protein [Patescibacteria group bacterium]